MFAIIVLVGMGFLLQSGDPYVGGHKLVATAEVKHRPSCIISMLAAAVARQSMSLVCPQDRNKRASACFAAAGCYAATLALSGVCWIRESRSAPTLLSTCPRRGSWQTQKHGFLGAYGV